MRFGFGHEGDPLPPAQQWCTHGATLNRPELRDLAEQSHQSTVRCRLLPRRGPIRAPFPPRAE